MTNMIQQRAMLASCSVKRWNPRVLDRKVSAEVQKAHNATDDAGDYRKQLVEKSALKALGTSAGTIRQLHYKLTLPWDDEGARLLPSATYQKYTDEMRVLKNEDERLRNDFYKLYPQLLAAAPTRLGSMFDPADFPDIADLPSKFDVKLTFAPIPDASDFRLDVTAEAADELRSQLVAEQDAKFQGAMRDCYRRVESVVSRISQTLSKDDPRIFDTLVTNAREIVQCMGELNIAGDPHLADLCQGLDAMLPRTARSLKVDPELRKKVAGDADALLAKMVGYV